MVTDVEQEFTKYEAKQPGHCRKKIFGFGWFVTNSEVQATLLQ